MISPERLLQLRERQFRTSTAMWIRAAEAALAATPGASNSSHPAHALWLRVELAKQEPVGVVLSGAQRSELAVSVHDETSNPSCPVRP